MPVESSIKARLFLTGWAQPVTAEEVKKRLDGFLGLVKVLDVILNSKRFAHVEVESKVTVEDLLSKLSSSYKNARWKGGLLKFELSKPDYLARLKAEKVQKNQLVQQQNTPRTPSSDEIENLRIRGVRQSAKRARIIEFQDDVDDEVHVTNATARYNASCLLETASKKVLESQDPAFCCSIGGDAGSDVIPVTAETVVVPETTSSADMTEKEMDSNDNENENSLVASPLSIYVLEHWANKNSKRKKHSPHSLLGQWFAMVDPNNAKSA